MSGTLALATSIASMDRAALTRLVEERRVLSPGSVREPLGLAVELLRSDSISRALQSAHRERLETLAALADGEPCDQHVLEALAATGLVGRSETRGTAANEPHLALPEVTELLPREFLRAEAPGDPTQKPLELTGWFAAALTSVRRVAKLLPTIASRPVRLGRKGQPAVIAVRDLAEAAHCSPDQAARLLDVMLAAGLVHTQHGRSTTAQLEIVDAAAQQWLMEFDYPARWIALAAPTISRFEAKLRRGITECAGNLGALASRLRHDYPLLPDSEMDALLRMIDTAEDLGLSLHGWLTPAADALLAGDEASAKRIAEQDIPAPAAGVYLQPDLSIIVPGPLAAADEAMLSAITETEQLGPAASLRISTARITRAVLRAGSGSQEVREALARLSLTGIPQPLDYLLRDLDRKQADHAPGFADVSHSPHLDALRIEQRDPDALPQWLQTDPTTESIPLPSHSTSAPEAPEELTQMIDRVLAAAAESGDEGDLTRRLELAIRDRSPIQVTAVAGNDQREFVLLPVSLKGGRLRATDQRAGVERTLPVSAITSVTSIPEA